MDQEARFERIESAHEALLKAVSGLVAVQAKQGENLQTIVGIMGDIVLAQANTEQQLALLAADHQDITAGHQDLTADLHLLDRFVDNWIREHGAKKGKSGPYAPPAV